MTAHAAPGAMAGRSERKCHALRRADEHPGFGAHAAADQDGLADFAKLLGQLRVSWAECARGSLPMNEEPPLLTIDVSGESDAAGILL